jgi:hypothetical protein
MLNEQENVLKSFFRGADSLPGTPYQISPLPPEKLTVRNVLFQTLGFAIRASLMATSPVFSWLQIYRLTFETPPPKNVLDLASQISKIWMDAGKNIVKDVAIRIKNATDTAIDNFVTPAATTILASMVYTAITNIVSDSSEENIVTFDSNPTAVSESIPVERPDLVKLRNQMERALSEGRIDDLRIKCLDFINVFAKFFHLHEQSRKSFFQSESIALEPKFYESWNRAVGQNYAANNYSEFEVKYQNLKQNNQVDEFVKKLYEFASSIQTDESGIATFIAGNAGKPGIPIPLIKNGNMYYEGTNNLRSEGPNSFFEKTKWVNYVWNKLGLKFYELYSNFISSASESQNGIKIFYSVAFASIVKIENCIIAEGPNKDLFLRSSAKFAKSIVGLDDQKVNNFKEIWKNIIEERSDDAVGKLKEFIESNPMRNNQAPAQTNENYIKEQNDNKSNNANPLVSPSGIIDVFKGSVSDVKLTSHMYEIINEIVKSIKIDDVPEIKKYFRSISSLISKNNEKESEKFKKIIEAFEKKFLSILPEKITSAWSAEYAIELKKLSKDGEPDDSILENIKSNLNGKFFGVSNLDQEKYESGFVLPARIYSFFRWLSENADELMSEVDEAQVDGAEKMLYHAKLNAKANDKQEA